MRGMPSAAKRPWMRSAGLASFEKRDDDDDEVVPAGFDAFLRNSVRLNTAGPLISLSS